MDTRTGVRRRPASCDPEKSFIKREGTLNIANRERDVVDAQAANNRGGSRGGILRSSDKLFVFLKRRDAEPTNNESERTLRPSVIFRKVTNGFRSEWGAKTYAALCSIVETGRRNGRSALTAIRDALALPAAQAAGAQLAHAA